MQKLIHGAVINMYVMVLIRRCLTQPVAFGVVGTRKWPITVKYMVVQARIQ